MKLGIYIGSFNPVHEGHIKVVNYLLDNNIVDKVIILPTPNYWDKQDLIDVKHRINMLKYYEKENIIIDDIHNIYPFTYEVFDSLKKDYKDDTLYLVIGSDNLPTFHLWKNIESILKNKIIVLKRNTIEKNPNIDDSNFIYIEDFEYLDVSSTDIRNGKKEYVNPKVLEYIDRHNLYK